jgi:hypothetical protein
MENEVERRKKERKKERKRTLTAGRTARTTIIIWNCSSIRSEYLIELLTLNARRRRI